ncbi:MAG: tRNA (guanosine(46)-N7)-methyltransferase TrmB [Treponema sp.]|nr:tRNA (guanosine(46)-N7)-methyltransferase TrmB [Treponema sp.]
MSPAQQRSYRELSPRFSVLFDSSGRILDYRALFGNSNPVTVEIGFGMGIATAEIAQANPGQNYLGLEVYRPGIGRLLWETGRRCLTNIRIIEHDAVETLEKMIGERSLAAFHIFFPDPWPKKRHHKRRLVTRLFTDLLARKLREGGYVYMVTDWEDYARRALAELSATPLLFNPYAGPNEGSAGESGGFAEGLDGGFDGGFAPRQPWRPQTSFEAKGIAGRRRVWELFFEKKSGERP